VVIVLR